MSVSVMCSAGLSAFMDGFQTSLNVARVSSAIAYGFADLGPLMQREVHP